MTTDSGSDSVQTSRRAPGLRITLDDIAAVLEDAAQRAGLPPTPSVAGASAPPPDPALIQRLAALAAELRDVNARLNQQNPTSP
jgi:hypothetical protein